MKLAQPPLLDGFASAETTSLGEAALTTKQKRAVIAAALGTVVEWADWLIYATFSSILAGQFFPSHDKTANLLSILAVFAVGFAARPVGGAVLGAFGDRYGRKRGLTLSVSLMAGASFIIGICPTYETIGVTAPIVLVIARLVQGFSAGGEFGSASTFLIESAPKDRRAFVGAWQHLAVNAGVMVAASLGLAMTFLADDEGMRTWGWRAGFITAGAMGLVVLWIRSAVAESEIFMHRAATQGRNVNPFRTLLGKHRGATFRVIGIAMAGNLLNYLWLVHYPTFIHVQTGMPLQYALLASIIAIGVSLLIIPSLGKLADRIGRKPVLLGFALGSAMFAWPSFALVANDFGRILLLNVIAMSLLSGFAATCATVMAEQFPAEVRATGVGFPFALSVTIFGGTAPYISTALASWGYGTYTWIYVAAVCLTSAAVYATMPETKGKELN
ncbi:MHS family alpha-ketoglutarate permease-like MFS transporter [Nitrobacteraceae bacterium AZCC 2299]